MQNGYVTKDEHFIIYSMQKSNILNRHLAVHSHHYFFNSSYIDKLRSEEQKKKIQNN